MTIIPFDTLEYCRTLQDAGIPQAHAEAHARALKTALCQMYDTLRDEQSRRDWATKRDLQFKNYRKGEIPS